MENNILGPVDKFMDDNEGLVHYVSNRLKGYLNPNRKLTMDKDDMLQLLRLGLFKAYQTFDDSKGYLFSTYAIRCMYNEFYRFLGSSKAQMIRKPKYQDGRTVPDIYEGSFEKMVGSSREKSNTEFDVIDAYYSVDVDFDKNLLIEELRTAISMLPDKHREYNRNLTSLCQQNHKK